MPVPSLKNQVVVVTGSSRGIGAAIAMRMAQVGCHVVVHGRAMTSALDSVRNQVEALNRKCAIVTEDFSTDFSADSFCDRAWEAFGRVDHWINNAGADVLTTEWRDAEFDAKLDHLIHTDLISTCRISRYVGRRMRSESSSRPPGLSPSIVNIGWDQAWQGMGGESGELFAAVKGAVMAFSRSLACTLAPDVRVNCVAPGWIRTAWGEQASIEWQERAVRECLVKRWGTPQDVALAVEFLCRHPFINGHVLPVNGGFDNEARTSTESDSSQSPRA